MSDFLDKFLDITWWDIANNNKVIPVGLVILVVCILYRTGCLDWMKPVRNSRRKYLLRKQFRSVFVDPETGVEYLVGDNGCFCPRLDSNGKVIINDVEDDY